jgi:hypothetical protein
MTDNKVIHPCSKCSKVYKNIASLQKHMEKCTVETVSATSVPVSVPNTASMTATPPLPKQSTPIPVTTNNSQKVNENTYDVNMTFVEGNKVKVDIKKQPQQVQASSDSDSDEESGEKVLKDILRPKVSNTYQDEIDKLENLINMFKTLPISDDPNKKDHTIEQLKKTVAILMTQSRNLIKEMKQMSRRNSYYRNNIMLAAFILDNCRKDVPETDEEFENMFS